MAGSSARIACATAKGRSGLARNSARRRASSIFSKGKSLPSAVRPAALRATRRRSSTEKTRRAARPRMASGDNVPRTASGERAVAGYSFGAPPVGRMRRRICPPPAGFPAPRTATCACPRSSIRASSGRTSSSSSTPNAPSGVSYAPSSAWMRLAAAATASPSSSSVTSADASVRGWMTSPSRSRWFTRSPHSPAGFPPRAEAAAAKRRSVTPRTRPAPPGGESHRLPSSCRRTERRRRSAA